jgi:hypothetical protein
MITNLALTAIAIATLMLLAYRSNTITTTTTLEARPITEHEAEQLRRYNPHVSSGNAMIGDTLYFAYIPELTCKTLS